MARALPLKRRSFGGPRRQVVDKTTPAAPGLKGAHDVSSWPKLCEKSKSLDRDRTSYSFNAAFGAHTASPFNF
jgi:hypothetical protein